ncbi:PCI domain-containing protein [Coniella lustricola]|uniref:PCI domain-containing protein n=1 Tax=Coniella lustricola TaxID=2025994 RepID=A0A2T2ZUT1_9PEZI|nr:PCI domain-containing protein [Coniella lustricola]
MALVTQFLTSIRSHVTSLDGDGLSAWFKVEPTPTAGSYFQLRDELKQSFASSAAIEKLVDSCMPEVDDPAEGTGSPWPSFIVFLKEYLFYWKDADFDDLLGLQELLSALLITCATALSHPQYGSLMFKTSISLSEALSKVVMMLHRRPELMAGRRAVAGDEDSKSMVEQSADIIQKIFTSCLTDRSSTRFARPEGRKVGVYIFANLVLKLLFTCGKSRLAAQLLLNVSTSGPPLQLYPAAQRVTYLYYLGRFNFDCDNFVRASLCLQEAYLQTPPALQQHRRLILTYLIPSNIMLGRFPSHNLLSRPEATILGHVFLPIMAAVRKGDFIAFQEAIAAHEDWLYRKGLLFTLMFRLRPIIWRSFTRRTFLLSYQPPPPTENSRAAPTLNLADVYTAATYVQKRLEGYIPAQQPQQHALAGSNNLFMMAVQNSAVSDTTTTSTLVLPPSGKTRKLKPSEGLFWGNLPVTMKEIEGVISALTTQGLMHGFLAHSSGKFAIMGAKKTTPLAAGWPSVAKVIHDRMNEEEVDSQEVPAWVKTRPVFS